MINESDVINALKALSNPATLKAAIVDLQMNHGPKHHEVTDVRKNPSGYGTSFFMKKKTKIQAAKNPWEILDKVHQYSEEFGDYIKIDNKDEATIINHLRESDSVAYAPDATYQNRFLLFTDVPHPYSGFDMIGNMWLPVQAGYLAMVMEKTFNAWKIITVFPCTRAFYENHKTKVLHF